MNGECGLHWRVGAARWGAAVLAFVTVVAVTLVAAAFAAHLSQRTRTQEARAETVAAAARLERRVDHYVEALRGVAAWLRTDGWPSRTTFHQFTAAVSVRNRYPGIQVIGAAQLVTAAGRTALTTALSGDSGLGYPAFRINPAGTGAALPITYLEPVAGNQAAFGFDFLSEARRRTAALAARDLGTPRLTAPVKLRQETGHQVGALVMVPVYRTGTTPGTLAQRRADFIGVVFGGFRMGDLVAGALTTDAHRVWLDDVGAASPLYAAAPRVPDGVTATQLSVEGRQWRVRFDVHPDLGPVTRYGPVILALVGTAVALLAGALLISLTSARARARALAVSMTAELRSVTDTATDAIVTVDHEGHVTAWNRGAAAMFGMEAGSILGAPLERVIPGGLAALTASAGRLGPHPDPTVEIDATRADGTLLHVEASVSTWGSPRGVFATAILRDVTARKRAQTEIKRTNDLLEGVLRGATECAIIGTDAHGVITVFNAGAQRMLGYRPEDAIGQECVPLMHDPAEIEGRAAELGMEAGSDLFGELLASGPDTREWTWVRSDGFRLPVLLTVTSLRDESGRIEGHIGIATDLTEAHRLERERARLATRFELLIDCSAEGFYGVDLDGRITFANQQTARYLGWEVEDLLGKAAHEVMHHHRSDGTPYPAEECPISGSFRNGTTHRIDSEVFWRRDGTSMAVEYVAAPLRRDGQIEGGVVTFSDITGRKRTERALQDAVAAEREVAGRLREIDQVRTDLVSTISHELRTPLTSISGYLELLMEGDVGPLTSEQMHMVTVAHRSSQRLLLLVEDLLTLSRMDAGAFHVKQDEVELCPLLETVASTISPLAAARNLSLNVDIPPGLGVVRGDSAHLERVLLNLLSNAVKFTPPGGAVSLSGRRVGNEAMVTVHDTGIGIPAEEQSRLFDRFFRSSNAMEEAVQGTGLGLSIVKTIVEHHGGRIIAASEVGEGTTMTVALPLDASRV